MLSPPIQILSTQLDIAIHNYATISAENQKLWTDIKVAITGLKNMEKAICIIAKTEFNYAFMISLFNDTGNFVDCPK